MHLLPEVMWSHIILAATGVATHQAFLSKGEHHMHVLRYLQIFIGAFLNSVAISIVNGDNFNDALFRTIFLSVAYLIGLYSSVTIYRLLLSPL